MGRPYFFDLVDRNTALSVVGYPLAADTKASAERSAQGAVSHLIRC